MILITKAITGSSEGRPKIARRGKLEKSTRQYERVEVNHEKIKTIRL